MPAYLRVENISKTYGLLSVLQQITFSLSEGQRVGLVGANGVGKSTLLKIIAGQIRPDGGEISISAGVALGYLPQRVEGCDHLSIHELLEQAVAPIRALGERMHRLAEAMALPQPNLDVVMHEYGEVADQFERRGGYELESHIDRILAGLDAARLPRQQAYGTLSGGEQARVNLARLLLGAPDVLILDEPTNHLDAAALEWLENYLAAYRGGVLVVSHDREFLNHTVNAILEIDEPTRRAKRYQGHYDTYHAAKVQERRQWEADYARQQEEIRALRLEAKETARNNNNYRPISDNDKFVKGIKIATHDNTVARRVHNAEEKLRRLEAEAIPAPPLPLRFDPAFDPAELKGKHPLQASGLYKSYGGRMVLQDVSLFIPLRSRVAFVGENGAGKSTLLKLLLGLEKPDSGTVTVHPAARLGYLSQEISAVQGSLTLAEAFCAGLVWPEQQAKTFLIRSGLFRYADFNTRVSALSSGQRRKLQIGRLIAEGANVLVLDEPTNDVSFDVLEGLEAALAVFPGTVIAATHDRRFLQHFGGQVWRVGGGRLTPSADGVGVSAG